jgi:hypothetical protein
MPLEHRRHSDTPSDDQPVDHADLNEQPESPETPDTTDSPGPDEATFPAETTSHDADDTPAPEEGARDEIYIAAARWYLHEHPPTEEDARDALLKELDAELNEQPDTPEVTDEATAPAEPTSQDTDDTCTPEGDARKDPFVAAERDLLEHPPTAEEIRDRDALLDELDASDTRDDSAKLIEAPHDLRPPHGEDSPPEEMEPRSSAPREKDSDHADLSSEEDAAPPAHSPTEQETRSPLESFPLTPREETIPEPAEPHQPTTPHTDQELRPQEASQTLEPIRDPHAANQPDIPSAALPPNLNLKRDLRQTHDSPLPPRTEPKELTPHEPVEPARTPPDPITLITAFTQTDPKGTERPSINQRLSALNRLLDRNPYFCDYPNVNELYCQAQAYIVVKALQARNDLPPYTQAETADRLHIATATLVNWLHDHTQPELINSLTAHEITCRHAEAQLPHEARDHRLDPTTIYDAFRTLRDHPATPHELATSIATLYRTTDHPPAVLFADFKPYHESGPRWMRTLADTIEDHRPEIERLVNQTLGFSQDTSTSLRLGVVDHTLFIWQRNTQPDNWLNLYAREYFYFREPYVKPDLVEEAKNHLNLPKLGLSHLITQVTDHPSEAIGHKVTITDLVNSKPHIQGETLHLLLNATNRTFEDLIPHIRRIGLDTQGDNRGGIHNPTFPTGEALNEFRARAYAIIVSDGSISRISHAPMYVQSNAGRIDYVRNLFCSALGDVHSNLETRPDGRMRLTMTVTVGRLLEKWGMPLGDKPLQNTTLPETIKNGTPETKRAYLQELIPEEGCFFRFTHRRGDFSVKRVSVLDAGTKAEMYGFAPIVNSDLKLFLRQYGNEHSVSIRHETPRKEIKMTWGELERLGRQEANPRAADMAREFKRAVLNNPCQLLEDERNLCRSLGIRVEIRPKQVCLHESGRVSFVWEARTKTADDAFRWAIQAPPSSGRKLEATNRWLAAYDKEVQSIRRQLQKDGLIGYSEKR